MNHLSRQFFAAGAAILGLFLAQPVMLPAQTLYVANVTRTLGHPYTIEQFTSGGVGTAFVDSGLNQPYALAFDPAGNLYVANAGNSTIVKITPGGAESVFASSGVSQPSALAFDSAGNLFAANEGTDTIEKFTPDGAGTVFASGLIEPVGLAFDAAGNLYVAEQGGAHIVKFTPDGVRSAFAPSSDPLLAEGGIFGLAFDAAGNLYVLSGNTVVKFTPAGTGTVFASTGLSSPTGLAFDTAGDLFVTNAGNNTVEKFTPDGVGTVFANSGLDHPSALAFSPAPPSSFFDGAVFLGGGAYYLSFADGDYFGYYSVLSDPHYIFHFDLGYEYVFDAADGKAGVYFYDFKSGGFFYTSPSFPFPYLYDFSLNTVLYYYPDPSNAGHYNTDGVRYFYRFDTGKIISK